MTTFYTLLITVLLSLFYKPSYAHAADTPFTTPLPLSLSTTDTQQPARVVSLKGTLNSNKALLQWTVDDNETADMFEVEKSVDGKNFVMAALVFGTDKPEADHYEFYERIKEKKISYRIKIIGKNKKTGYSDILLIESKQ